MNINFVEQNKFQNENLPDFLSKDEMLSVLQQEEYGFVMPKLSNVSIRKKALSAVI